MIGESKEFLAPEKIWRWKMGGSSGYEKVQRVYSRLKQRQHGMVRVNTDKFVLSYPHIMYENRKAREDTSPEREFLTEWCAHNNSIAQNDTASAPPTDSGHHTKQTTHHYVLWSVLLVLTIALLCLIACAVNMRTAKSMKVKRSMKNTVQSSPKTSIALTEVKQEEQHPELVFFVEEEERFRLENLLDAGADMQSQNFCSSLYKVQLNNIVSYAVKRLKKLQASAEEFDRTMTKVGKLNHPNILPLIAYNCQGEEKLLIYKYQNNGSLLSLMESKPPCYTFFLESINFHL
nr:protein kinase, catalytic domain-containing protein [Tanacetum cinerariifolium]